jgi:hypothetical protein
LTDQLLSHQAQRNDQRHRRGANKEQLEHIPQDVAIEFTGKHGAEFSEKLAQFRHQSFVLARPEGLLAVASKVLAIQST